MAKRTLAAKITALQNYASQDWELRKRLLGMVKEDSIPNCKDRGGHLYVLEIVGVGVKFGVSTAPRKRLLDHVKSATNHMRDVGRAWVSAYNDCAYDHEAKYKKRHGGREYLHGAEFETVVIDIMKIGDKPALFQCANVDELVRWQNP